MSVLTKEQKAQGWVEGSIADFLGLSAAEEQLIEIKHRLARGLKAAREASGLSQAELAQRLGTKQPNVARMEKGEGRVTIDTVIVAILEAGGSRADIAQIIRDAEPPSFAASVEHSPKPAERKKRAA